MKMSPIKQDKTKCSWISRFCNNNPDSKSIHRQLILPTKKVANWSQWATETSPPSPSCQNEIRCTQHGKAPPGTILLMQTILFCHHHNHCIRHYKCSIIFGLCFPPVSLRLSLMRHQLKLLDKITREPSKFHHQELNIQCWLCPSPYKPPHSTGR